MVETRTVAAARALCSVGEDILELDNEYGFRWFVPLGSAMTRYGGLGMLPALRWRSRLYRAALRAWTLAGAYGLQHVSEWRLASTMPHPRRVIRKDEEEWELGAFLRPYMPTVATAAVSAGTPGLRTHRKVTARLLDRKGRTLGFAKYAITPEAQAILANEKRMLKLIPPGLGPNLVCFAPFLEGTILVQTPLPGRPRGSRLRLNAALMHFLGGLARPEVAPRKASEHPFVADLYARSAERVGLLDTIVAELGTVEWPVVLAHGELSPWNLHEWRGTYLAFDWEYGKDSGFAYLDAAHYLIQIAGVVKGLEPRRARHLVSDALRPWLPAQHRSYAATLPALAALNMLTTWFPPREPDAQYHWLDEFARLHP
jgi:hypothetical protein